MIYTLRSTFLALLVSALFVTLVVNVEAVPIAKRRASASGMFSMPLKRMERTRGLDVHPQIMLQQNINRSRRRHARMTGRTEPSDLELREALERRIESLDLRDGLGKRSPFNRSGARGGKRDMSIGEFLEARKQRVGLAGGKSARDVEAREPHNGGHHHGGHHGGGGGGNNGNGNNGAGGGGAADASGSANATETATASDDASATDIATASDDASATDIATASDDASATDIATATASDDASATDIATASDDASATDIATASDDTSATDIATDSASGDASATDSASDSAGGDASATDSASDPATATASASDDTGSGSATESAGGATPTGDEGTVAPADSVTPSDDPATADSVAFDIEGQDIGYLATVQIGTPPVNFELLMDSGSADTWVGGEACQSEAGGACGNHEFLGTTSSSSFKASDSQFQVTYGTGSVQGTIISDNLAVAGISLDNHVFGAADVESVEFSDDSTSFDGLMGLAQSTLSNQGTLTPPEAMAKAGLIDKAIVSYKIPRLADGLLDGEVTFGGLDESKFDASTLVTLDNVSPDGFWEAAMDAATVDGTDTGLTGRTAILDTGTTLILAPQDDAIAIHNLIDGATTDGQGSFSVPCTTTASISLTFGGQEFTIDSRDLAFAPLDANDPEGDCLSGISAGNVGGATEWLVGDVFLKNAYFSHNVDDNSISLAKLV